MQGSEEWAPAEPALSQALRASEARFRNVIERNADGILVVGTDGVILFANQAAAFLLNRPAQRLMGEQFGIPIIAGETTEVDLPLPGGGHRVAEMRVVGTEWERKPALLATLRDISDRKRLEEELRQKIAELAQADRRKDEFLAMLAHELRNPLAPILSAAHVMKMQDDDPQIRARMRDMIEDQVRSMARLVDDLLDVSRITRGKIALRLEPVSPAAILRRAVETTRPQIQAKSHELRVTLLRESIKIWVDPLRIEQAVVNLLANAAKYTDPGGLIQLHAGISGGELVIRVRDNGVGIEREMLDQVFSLFTQADQSLDRSQGGLGIGLTLAQNLVRLHGGDLTATSEGLGRGSEFVIRIPCREAAHEPAKPTPEFRNLEHVRVRRVLIVDDNVPGGESLRLIVKLWGHEARVVTHGSDAIEAVAVFRPDVVILDIGLPGMDGYSIARVLRSGPDSKNLLLIAMTGYGRDEDRALAFEAGFDHHLVKPVDLAELERVLIQGRDWGRRAGDTATSASEQKDAFPKNGTSAADHERDRRLVDRESCG